MFSARRSPSLYPRIGAEAAAAFINSLLQAVGMGLHRLIHIPPDQFHAAWDMRQKYADKLDVSFVDFTSMVVMRDLGLVDVFTGDRHFAQVGLGFRLWPESE